MDRDEPAGDIDDRKPRRRGRDLFALNDEQIPGIGQHTNTVFGEPPQEKTYNRSGSGSTPTSI